MQRCVLLMAPAELTSRGHPQAPTKCIAFLTQLGSCAKNKDLSGGALLHDDLIRRGLVGQFLDALVTMYAKCGALEKAEHLFDIRQCKDVFTWTSLIAGYVQKGRVQDAIDHFDRMRHEGLSPDSVTFTCILKASGSMGAIDRGEKIHAEIFIHGLLQPNVVLGTALVDMYARCGALSKAWQVHEELPERNVVSWTALITRCSEQGEAEKALDCFAQMQREGLCPNVVTFISIVKACGNIKSADTGGRIHDEIIKQGLLRSDLVLGNSLIDMYAKCGALAKAHSLLKELPVRDIISWNTLIAGYAQQHEIEPAFKSFEGMQHEGLFPDAVTFACLLKACGKAGAADNGERFHDEISKQGLLRNNVVLGNALVDMYVKCGLVSKARRVLEELPIQNAISWNALMTGYVQQCEAMPALMCFEQMQCEGLFPDEATFSCLLSTCSRVGLIEDAPMLLVNMSTEYAMDPDLEHYSCIVDLFGRLGCLDKAAKVFEKLPSSAVGAWSALLSACSKWGGLKVGRWAFEHQEAGICPCG